MLIKFKLHVITAGFIFIICSKFVKTAIYQKCPPHSQHFEKVLGFRPDTQQYTHVLYRNTIRNSSNAINYDCWQMCHRDVECSSYVLFLSTFECFGFSQNPKTLSYQFLPEQIDLVSDPNSVYFEKTCIKVPAYCRSKLWSIVRVPGSILVGQGNKQLPSLVSRRDCAEKCISESEFQCLSATFVVSHKNNLFRLNNDKLSMVDDVDVGQCTLNEDDKMTRSDSYRVANIDEEYIENQCVDRAPTNVFCSFEQYTNSNFVYSEFEENGLSQKECQERCTLENRFYCQGVSFFRNFGRTLSRCYLHSEDTISLGPRAMKFQKGGIYLRRVKCLNLTVTCDKSLMTVEYKPNHIFNGLLYVNSHVKECATIGEGFDEVTLKIPLGNETQESRCGIIRAYELTGSWNRTLISTLIVIQKNANIQTQGDRLVKVGCILSDEDTQNDDLSIGSSIEFGTTNSNQGAYVVNATAALPKVYMKIIDLNENQETNDVQLGQNLEFQLNVEPPNVMYDIQPKNLIARSADGSKSVKLLDENGCSYDSGVFPELKRLVTPTSQSLRTRFQAFKFVDSPGVRFETLIHFCVGECPFIDCTRINKRPIRQKRQVESSSKIVTNNPGKITFPTERSAGVIAFPNSSVTKRDTTVEDEPTTSIVPRSNDIDESPDNIWQSVISYKNETRMGKELLASVGQTNRNNFTDFKRILRKPIEIPLNFEIKVHSPQAGETESLVYGENSSILVAGYGPDIDNTKLCISPGLIVIVLALWLLIQVVLLTGCCVLIKKYRKLAELEDDRRSLHRIHQSLDSDSLNRRVRWADQGSTFSSSQVLFATT